MSPAPAATDRIELRGLRVVGTHGLLPEERERSQPFEVDVDIVADLSDAGRTDDLTDTVDYGAVAAAAAAVVGGEHAELLEHLAQRIVDAVFETAGPRASEVAVRITKLRPPVPFDMASSAVFITRTRG